MRKSRALVHEEILPFTEVQKPDHVPSYKTGWSFFDEYLRWSDKEVVVGCGQYAGGKSQLFQMFACDFADVAGRHMGGARSAICGLEDADWRIKRNIERFAMSREAKDPSRGGTSGRIKFMLDNVHRIGRPAGAGVRDIAWFLDRARTLHLRDDCRFFALDPWNQHDEQMAKAELETQYVNRMLRDICQFAEEHKVIVSIVTHIAAKSYDEFGTRNRSASPKQRDQATSGGWQTAVFALPAQRACLERVGEDRMVVKFDKAKDEEKHGTSGRPCTEFRSAGNGYPGGRARGSPSGARVLGQLNMTHPRNIFRDSALKYAALGWPVFPLAKGAKVPMKELGWLQVGIDESGKFSAWVAQHPHNNIAAATGPSRASS